MSAISCLTLVRIMQSNWNCCDSNSNKRGRLLMLWVKKKKAVCFFYSRFLPVWLLNTDADYVLSLKHAHVCVSLISEVRKYFSHTSSVRLATAMSICQSVQVDSSTVGLPWHLVQAEDEAYWLWLACYFSSKPSTNQGFCLYSEITSTSTKWIGTSCGTADNHWSQWMIWQYSQLLCTVF